VEPNIPLHKKTRQCDSLIICDTKQQLSSGNQGINTALAYTHYANAEMKTKRGSWKTRNPLKLV